ncbi:MAG: SGNH/GDSL hydrolase family protein [Acidimicrobiales bacterium]
MQNVDLTTGAIRFAGIAEIEPTDAGAVLHRMPAWARAQHNDLSLALLETMPAGGRLEFDTSATVLEVVCHLTHVRIGDEARRPAVFDLVIDGELIDSKGLLEGTLITVDPRTGGVSFTPGGDATVTFALPSGHKHVALWLPHATAVRVRSVSSESPVTAPTSDAAFRWTNYGSSISHCFEADRPTGTWPAIAARLAGADLQSFAFAGQCHLDPFAARMIAAHPADAISLKLGINIVNADSMRERTFVPALHGFLDTIRDRQPDTPIAVITPITCPVAEAHPGPTTTVDGTCRVHPRPVELATGALTLERIRQIEREVVEARRRDDPHLHLIEGPDLFGPDDVHDLPDGLHPNAAGYQRMGERFHRIAFTGDGPFASLTA